MENKALSKYQTSFIYKMKHFFMSFFNKKDKLVKVEKLEIEKKIAKNNLDEKNIFEQMSLASKKEKTKQEILDLIDSKPEFIHTLPYSKLKELISLYDKDIEERELRIKKLKRKLGRGNN